MEGIKIDKENLEDIIEPLNHPGLTVLSARPLMGKTTLAMNIAMYKSEHCNENVVIFSLELPEKQLRDQYHIQDKSFIHIIDDCLITVSQIKEKLKMMKNTDLVIIDYLQLVESESEEKNRINKFMNIGKALKKLSQELNIPVLLLSQLSRRLEFRKNHHPVLQDLIEFDIEQDIDTVMFLYRDSYYVKNREAFDSVLECTIAKNKYGETKTVPLNCHSGFSETGG